MFAHRRFFARFFPIFSVASLIFSASIIANADTIKLKDGSVIKGKIVDFKNQQMTVVRTGTNNRTSQITVEADEVESVEFDSVENLTALINTARPGTAQTTAASNSVPNNSVVITNTNNPVVNAPVPTPRPAPSPTANNNSTVSRPTTNQPTGSLTSVINSRPTSINPDPRPGLSNNGRFVPLSVKVLADNTANGWTNTGLVVKKGQRIRVAANGRISLGSGKSTTPAGIGSLTDNERLMKTEPTGALIAVIGDDNNDFIFIGSSRDFEAPRDGTLFLGVNEGNLEDNSGAFETTVEAEVSNATAQKVN